MTRILLACSCIAILFCVSNRALQAEETVHLERFEKTIIAGNLIQPMELDIAPDGSIFIIELGGDLKRLWPMDGRMETVGHLTVTTAQENGLIGLALDPNFASNGWIYLQYSPPDFEGQHVSRFVFENNVLDLSSEKILLKYQEQRQECCHHAGSLEFGPQGDLYIGTGDNTNPFNDSDGYAPIDQRSGRQAWDAQRTASNTKSHNGKVLRIHPEPDGTYSVPDGNLFPRDGSLGLPEIYVMGCRNPWRICIDQRTGFLYWGDVGPDAGQDNQKGPRGYDEVNQARQAGYFGWPLFIGNNFAYPIIDFTTGKIGAANDPAKPINLSVNNTGVKQLPPATPAMIYYPSGTSQEFPAMETGGRTACAGPVYYFDDQLSSETKFPKAYDRTLFAFEWSRSMIYAVHLDDDSRLKSIERFLPEMSFVRPIDMQFDSQGSLYVIEYGETWGVNPDAKLVRIDYVRGNRKPTAMAQVQNGVGREPLTVSLSAQGSSDRDGDTLRFEWSAVRSHGEKLERLTLGSGQEVSATFDMSGVYTIELTAIDPSGATAKSSVPVIVGNMRPEVTFLTPADGDFFTPGQTVRYELKVRDYEDGTSDYDEADGGEIAFIDGSAPSRVMVEALPGGNRDEQTIAPGLELIRKSDCLNCHAAARRIVGPSFLEIADKYRDQPHQQEVSIKRVKEGSTGVWGKVAMLPHAQHSDDELHQMVEYVFSVSSKDANPSAQGFTNQIETKPQVDSLILEAAYTDLGRGEIPALLGVTQVRLRNRTVQAESADMVEGTTRLDSSRAQGNAFMGAINHNGFLLFKNVPLAQFDSLELRVASAGAGGNIEVHVDSTRGPVIATVPVRVNGEWESFYSQVAPVKLPDGVDSSSLHDLYFVFVNEQNRGGLMNVDSITFRKEP